MRVVIASDHGGYELKADLKRWLSDAGHLWVDLGCDRPDPVDYPDFALAVAEAVGSGLFECGIVIDGAGIGSCMTANKVPGVRAALCHDLTTAANAREHNDANVLTLGGGLVGKVLARQIVDTFLNTAFGEGRHRRRVDKILAVEAKYLLRPRGA